MDKIAFTRIPRSLVCLALTATALVAVIPAGTAQTRPQSPPATPPAAPTSSATAATVAPTATAAVATPDWPSYHGNNIRSGYAPSLKTVTTTPKQAWNLTLDGAVYGSPVVVAGGNKIVVTENNSVYRIAGNQVVWRNHLGAPVPQSALPCGNIDPTGITSTPAYDATTHTLVVVAFLQNPFRHIAVGLDPLTGKQRWFRNVDVPASVPGITPRAMQQRGALLVSRGRVYVPYGGLAGDCSTYRGSVVGLDLAHPASAALWHFTVPTSREAGIWAASGIAENPGAGILVAVGNGDTAATGTYDHSDSVLKLSNQAIADSFSPTTWLDDNARDLDLGTQGPTVVGSFIFISGKRGIGYVLDRSHLGGIGGQRYQANLCASFGGTAVVGNIVYVPCTDGLRAVRINPSGTFTVLWHTTAAAGSPVVGGGRVWALDQGSGRLHMFNPSTGADLGSFATGAVSRFATPALYSNAVIVGTMTGVVAFNW
jgi:hypothetical protein